MHKTEKNMQFIIRRTCLCLFTFACGSIWSAESLSISTNPAAMTISIATAGQQPNSVTNTNTNYSVTTASIVRNITGAINSNMPNNVTLRVQLAAPSGAKSTGSVAMTTTNKNLVTTIPRNSTASGLRITYTLSATVQATVTSNATKILTLTLQ